MTNMIHYTESLNNFLNKKAEFEQAEKEYIKLIEEFCHNQINCTHISFERNKMYLTFESFNTFTDKYLLKFCDEFGFLAPIIEFKELNSLTTLYKFKFIKIL